MRCNWSHTASILLQRAVRRCNVLSKHELEQRLVLSACANSRPLSLHLNPREQRTSRSSQFSMLATSTIPPPAPRNSDKLDPLPINQNVGVSEMAAQRTDPQLSRAASQTVRLLTKNGDFENAFYVVNSLRHSTHIKTYREAQIGQYKFFRPGKNFNPIDFGRPISPRLSAHVLLHALIRDGQKAESTQLAEMMMKTHIKVRVATLEIAIRSLLPQNPSQGDHEDPNPVHPTKRHSEKGIGLEPELIQDQGTSQAVRLLIQARRYRHRRTQEMFQNVIHSCLLQGEILVGSLLFILVIKDWHLRRSMASRQSDCKPSEEKILDIESQHDVLVRFRLRHQRSENLFPDRLTMYKILSSIDATILRAQHEEIDPQSLQAALQALANLAMLLANRQIPFPEIAPLIRSLYSCPRFENEVWVQKPGGMCLRKAHSYFNSVLKKLINSLPTHRSGPKGSEDGDALRPLDISAYNALLNYSLRHRLSPGLAGKVLTHMTSERYKPLAPDNVTFNILLRSGTLIRRPDLAEKALKALRSQMDVQPDQHPVKSNESVSREPSTSGPPRIRFDRKHSYYRFQRALRQLQKESIGIPRIELMEKPDIFSITSYLLHLTSTGHPHVVADLLFRFLPELHIIDHPSWGSATPEERTLARQESREACLRRAVAYGPRFFAAVLNALRKAGKTGLAERVWHLAKEAERASWIHDFAPDCPSWCLSVHSYTTMLQCYGSEARKGLQMRRAGYNGRYIRIWGDGRDWKPQTKRFVRGWGQFVFKRNRLAMRDVERASEGRRMGLLLFRSMFSGAQDIFHSFMELRKQAPGRKFSEIPLPDARFFNAALDLFARQPNTQPRGSRAPRAHWRRQYRLAHLQHARLGVLPKHWNEQLQEIAEQMAKYGYAVPPALRYLFVGRWMPQITQQPQKLSVKTRPFAFPVPARETFRPHGVPFSKNRGLPIGRRRRRAEQNRRKKREC